MLKSTFFLPTASLVDKAISLVGNIPILAVFCRFLKYTNRSLTLLLSLRPLRWLRKRLRSIRQTDSLS